MLNCSHLQILNYLVNNKIKINYNVQSVEMQIHADWKSKVALDDITLCMKCHIILFHVFT